MYLSKLKLFGFKSFANKTILEFNSGISCIIGPNGSGKSNIVDAIRWVLGEQRTSLLRSDKMENVIFNGTHARKPVGMAEVAMTIENNKGILKTDFNEVVIARRLYRSGESQYLINNTPVRLKDVLDIFMDTGLGSNSYSVIELKMVESILSENKNERRQLFEEAAGVVKYKVRRKSALRKLEATRTDLTRLNDIISEVQKAVNSLSRQVGKARRYLSYTEELKKLDVDLARFRYNRLLDEIRPLSQQLKEVSKIKEESHHQITIDEALLEEYKREHLKTEQEMQELNQTLHELDAQVAQISQEQAIAQTRSEEMVKNRARYLSEIEDFQKRIQILQENIAKYEDEIAALTRQKEIADEHFARIEGERQSELEKIQQEKQEIEQLNARFRQKFEEVSSLKEALRQNEFQIQFRREQIEQLTAKFSEQKLLKEELQQKHAQLLQQREQLNAEREQLKQQLKELQTAEENALQNLEALQSQKNMLTAELERLNSRRQFFEQIIANYEGHARSTQFVMKRRQDFPGLIGPLSDIFTVDDTYSRATEILLGHLLDYVLVENVADARKLIALVEKENQGRITIIPLKKIPQVTAPQSASGDLHFLTDFVRSEARFKNLLHLLIGDVAVAGNLDEALSLAERHPQLRFITPQGEIVSFNREISAGQKETRGASVIGRKEQLKKYEALAEKTAAELQKVKDQMVASEAEIERLRQEQQQLNNRLNQLYQRSVETEKRETQVLYEINKIVSDQKQKDSQLQQLQAEIEKSEKENKDISGRVTTEQHLLNELEKETIQKTRSYEQNSSLVESLLDEVQQARIQASNLQNQLNNRTQDLARTAKEIETLQNTIEHHQAEIEQIDQSIVLIEQQNKERRQQQQKIWEKRDTLEEQRNKIEQALQEIKTQIYETEEQTRKYRRQHDSSLEKGRALELKINEHRYKAETLREQILKEYSEDIEVGIPYDDLNEQESEERIETLRARIKNLGAVNPLAVSEYDKEKERLDFLTQQRDDLLKAEKSLLETIDKINKTARGRFLETFEAIRENFEQVFKTFFERGEGSISLEQNEDPLEADIDIKVRTKGRQLQTLTLLSGGEKTLTAISLLFAIYLVKPSPFCVLDEVDAPLDDVNVYRFTKALENFSKNTQFIVVTHNKNTMEAASTMYGVTMEEEGISKLVSVKFT